MAETVLIEILSADPIGPLSLSQGRTAVQGDVLANLFAFFGAEVRREYYVNDMARRIAILCDAVRDYALRNVEGDAVDDRYDSTVRAIARRLLEERRDALHAATDEEWDRIFDSIPGLLLEAQRATLERLGVSYSTWFEERNLTPEVVEDGIRRLRDSGKVRAEGGSVWMESEGRDRALLRRGNGDFTYFAVDIAYHLSKVERGAGRMVDVWGPAYHRHRDRLLEALGSMGVSVPLEVLVTGGIRFQTDGMPVDYLDAATVDLNPFLERGSIPGLRHTLNSAPPEADLVLGVHDLNRTVPPPAVAAAWAAVSALGEGLSREAGEPVTLERLQADTGAMDSGQAGDLALLVTTVGRTETALRQAWSMRRPDLLNSHLRTLTQACAGAGGPARMADWDEPVRRGAFSALSATLSLRWLRS